MPLGEFCDSFRITADERDSTQCLNCLSLEVSDSALGNISYLNTIDSNLNK